MDDIGIARKTKRRDLWGFRRLLRNPGKEDCDRQEIDNPERSRVEIAKFLIVILHISWSRIAQFFDGHRVDNINAMNCSHHPFG
jgi:hypothetical protein